jgi:hypothetical protein
MNNVQHLESSADRQADLDEFLTPDESAQNESESHAQEESDVDQGESWEEVNARLSGKAKPEDREASEVEKLRMELEEARKEKATFEKRMKDTHRAFTERTEELKRIREEQQALKSSMTKTENLQEDLDSGNVAAPKTEKDMSKLAKEYDLTEEEMEFFEIYPEGMNAIEKILAKRLDTGLSEREKQREMAEKEARAKAIEKEIEDGEHAKWMSGVKSFHKDADKLIDSQEFNAWLNANEPLRLTILTGKKKYDPTGLVEIIDHYKTQKAEIDRVRANRQFNRQATLTPRSLNTSSNDRKGEKSWAQINAELKKQKSR